MLYKSKPLWYIKMKKCFIVLIFARPTKIANQCELRFYNVDETINPSAKYSI